MKKLKEHEKEFYHFSKANVFPLIGVIGFGLLSYFNFSLLNLNLKSLTFTDFYVYVLEYLYLSGLIISVTALIKGGYNKLKSFKEKGLIWGLIAGLIGGLIIGLLAGEIIGLFEGLAGLIFGLLAGLITGLITGLIIGLEDEYD